MSDKRPRYGNFHSSSSQNEHATGASLKRKAQNVANGDRFCSSCGFIMRGQAVKFTAQCMRDHCKQFQPLSGSMWAFSNGLGRCSGQNCNVVLLDTMAFCYYCGACNEVAVRKKEREAQIQLDVEKKKAGEKEKAYQAEIEQMRKQLAEKDETINRKEEEYFKKLVFEAEDAHFGSEGMQIDAEISLENVGAATSTVTASASATETIKATHAAPVNATSTAAAEAEKLTVPNSDAEKAE